MYGLNAKAKNSQKGFSLIQMAIGLCVLGILIAPFGNAYYLHEKKRRMDETFLKIERVVGAIRNFKGANGYYPCPAPINVARDDSTYGSPLPCNTPAFAASVPVNSCGEGVCVEQSINTTITNRRLVYGAIPFRVLQMDERNTVDPYNSRITYVVTESMTNTETFSEKFGGIAVYDENDNSLSSPDASIGFIVLSHGPNKIGAYNVDGVLGKECTGQGKDVNNCNKFSGAAPATNLNGIYIAATQNAKPGDSFFDDTISFFSQIAENVWKKSDANQNDILDLSNNFVGLSVNTPEAQLDIMGGTPQNYAGIGIETPGRLLVNEVCNVAGTHCFDPRIIGGTLANGGGMECPSGQFMVGIGNNGPICDFIGTTCTGTQVFSGVNSDGTAICTNSPGAACPAASRTLCATNDISLPASTDQQTHSFNIGSCRSITYKCANGAWTISTAAAGQCNFTGTPTTNNNMSCGRGFENGDTYSETTTPRCVGASTVTNTRAADCTCVGGTFPNGSLTCSSRYGNNANVSGTITQFITYNMPSCSTTNSEDTSGCICNAPPVTTEWRNEGSCAAGQLGTRQRKYVFNPALASCRMVATDEYRGCSCDTTPRVTRRDHVCDNSVCEKPKPTDQDIITREVTDATTCALGPEVITNGSCEPRSFKWVKRYSKGTQSPVNPGQSARYIGYTCSCSNFSASSGGVTHICYEEGDATFSQYECTCAESSN